MDSATLSEARKHLGTVVDRARHGGKATLLTDHGAPAAVIMSAEKYAEYQELLAERDEREFRARLADPATPAVTLAGGEDVQRFFEELGAQPGGDIAASA